MRIGTVKGFGWLWLALGLALLWMAVHALASSVSDALNNGTVLVNSYARGRPRQLVPWFHAWAYFLGLVLLVIAAFSVAVAASGRVSFVLPAIAFAPSGFLLVLFSAYLSTLRDTAFLVVFFIVAAGVFAINKRFGRFAAVACWAVVVIWFIFWYV